MNKTKKLNKSTTKNLLTYALVIVAFVVLSILSSQNIIGRQAKGLLIPGCCYIVMAISLNLVVGVLGDLSLGHAGFMSIGAFSGIIAAMSLADSIPNTAIRLIIAIVVGAVSSALAGFLIGIPVLRLHGDYLAIVTLAFGEIIKELITCLLVGYDENGLHAAFNYDGTKSIDSLGLSETGRVIIKGAQGATGTETIASFTAGFILILVALFIALNLIGSRTGRNALAIRDNRIAAESVGINVTRTKMIVFVISAALAGAAGALYGLNYSNLVSAKFDFNTSITVLVFVVLGGLGNMTGSIIAAAVLYVLPEAFRSFGSYRMLTYAVVLILVMVFKNDPKIKALFSKILPKRKQKGGKGDE